MDKIFDNILKKYKEFMKGRYGNDNLNSGLIIIYLVAWILRIFTGGFFKTVVLGIMWGVLLFILYRFFSTNIEARKEENRQFNELKKKILGRFNKSDIKDENHSYFNCPNCNLKLRVPKGIGKIRVDCPKCNHEFSQDVK